MAEAGPKLLRGLLEVFVLESLEQQPKHGYALLKEMGETFGQQPNRNRLYPLLAKLVAEGYIRELSESGGNRTLYTLTDPGREALAAYRRLPPAFRHAVRRIWGVETHPEYARPPRRVPVQTEEDADADLDAEADAEGEEDADEAGAPATRPPVGELPYPCPDAEVTMRKEPRSGDLRVTLTGCPMGTYEYCPECPVYSAVQGLRRLALGE